MAIYLTNPKKAQTLVLDLWVSHCDIQFMVEELGSMPWAEIWCPKNSISSLKNWHLAVLQYSFTQCRASMIMFICLVWSAVFWDQIIISSKYTWHILPMHSQRVAIVNLINCFKVYHRLAVPDKYCRVLPVCSCENFSHKSFSKILLTQVIVLRLNWISCWEK